MRQEKPGVVYSILVVRFQNLSDVVTVRDLLRRREHTSLTTLIATVKDTADLCRFTSSNVNSTNFLEMSLRAKLRHGQL